MWPSGGGGEGGVTCQGGGERKSAWQLSFCCTIQSWGHLIDCANGINLALVFYTMCYMLYVLSVICYVI